MLPDVLFYARRSSRFRRDHLHGAKWLSALGHTLIDHNAGLLPLPGKSHTISAIPANKLTYATRVDENVLVDFPILSRRYGSKELLSF